MTPMQCTPVCSIVAGRKSVILSALATQVASPLVTTLPLAPSRTMSLFRQNMPVELDDTDRTIASRRSGVPEEEVTTDPKRPAEALLSMDDLDAILEQENKRDRSVIVQFFAE